MTFGVKPVLQLPVGNGIVRALMIEARWAIHIADDLRRAGHALDDVLRQVELNRADLAGPEGQDRLCRVCRSDRAGSRAAGEPGYGLKPGRRTTFVTTA